MAKRKCLDFVFIYTTARLCLKNEIALKQTILLQIGSVYLDSSETSFDDIINVGPGQRTLYEIG